MHLLEYTLCNLSELCKKENKEISDLLIKIVLSQEGLILGQINFLPEQCF